MTHDAREECRATMHRALHAICVAGLEAETHDLELAVQAILAELRRRAVETARAARRG